MTEGPSPPDAALAEVFRKHAAGLAGAIRAVLGPGADPAEALQDASLKALSALRAGERPHDLAAWVFVIAINRAKDLRRQRRRAQAHWPQTDLDAMHLQAEQPPASAALETQEAVAAARAAIAKLDDAEKDVFLLRVSGDLTFEAAAQALGIPVGTAKTRMRAALQRLRGELRPFAPDAPRKESI